MQNYVLVSDGTSFADIETQLRKYLPGLDVRLFQYSPRQAIIRAPLVRALDIEYPNIGVGPLFKAIGIASARPVSDTETVALLAGRDRDDLEPRSIVQPASPLVGVDWHIALARVPQAWALLGGPDNIDWTGVRVGHIDTGYTEHPALGFPATWLRTDLARSFVPAPSGEQASILAPELGNGRDNLDGFNAGHGTRIGATISGYAPNAPGGAFYGVAPKVPLVPVRITDTVEITARQRQFEDAVRYLVDSAGVGVINLSMGVALGIVVNQTRRAVDYAWDHGVILVCAAGNYVNDVVAPARLNRALAVGGVTSTDAPWSGSSFGPTVDMSGPAADVRRAQVKRPNTPVYSYAEGGDGTSYATGMTTGAAALWLAHRGAEIAAAYAAVAARCRVHAARAQHRSRAAELEPQCVRHRRAGCRGAAERGAACRRDAGSTTRRLRHADEGVRKRRAGDRWSLHDVASCKPRRHRMASIHKEIIIDAPPHQVWDAVRDVGAVHTRVAPGFLTGCRMEDAPLARVVSFANGIEARELIVDIDDAARRLVWSVVGGRMTHHNASMQIVDEGAQRTRVVWIADLLPHELAPAIAGMIDQGMAAMQRTLGAPR